MNETKKKGKWTISDIPSQKGRLIAVTGIRGLGYVTAEALAAAGAEVILLGRNRINGESAAEKIRSSVPSAKVHFEEIDLADLASIEAAAKRMCDSYPRLDVLINNAAEIMNRKWKMTKDGFELHFGTNHLGHFALTAQLFPLLRKGRDPRVVTVSALAANSSSIDFDDLQQERNYKPMSAYGHSKLANLLFSFELHKRSVANNWGIKSIAVHPGLSRSFLVDSGMKEKVNVEVPLLFRMLMSLIMQSPERGVLPTLFAVTSSEAVSGQYYGPDGPSERKGFPAPAKITAAAKDVNTAKLLWETSKLLTHVDFDTIASRKV